MTSLRDELRDFRPDRIGVSLRNVDNAAYPCSSFYLPSYAALLNSIRTLRDVPIILGGSAFSLFPEEISGYLAADGGVWGEGEHAIDTFRTPGVSTAPAERLPLDDVSFPGNISRMFPGFIRYRTIGIQTARGCPHTCVYCTYPHLEGRQLRTRSPASVAGEIAMLYEDYGARDFFIVNSIFNADEGHMVLVLEEISALNLPVRISCYLKPQVSDPGIFRLMKKAGCVAVDFGTDSGSPAMLTSLRKSFAVDDIRKASRACRAAGVDFCHSLIFGGPGETPETIRETISLMDEISPKAVIAMTGVRIYPGTGMRRIAIADHTVSEEESLLEPRFYFPAMGPSALLKLVYEAAERKKNWFFPGKRDWGSALGFRILHFLYRKGPLWRTFRK
jgi:radical SAM superfamily enzyme YgiQ (UPF0313 family)